MDFSDDCFWGIKISGWSFSFVRGVSFWNRCHIFTKWGHFRAFFGWRSPQKPPKFLGRLWARALDAMFVFEAFMVDLRPNRCSIAKTHFSRWRIQRSRKWVIRSLNHVKFVVRGPIDAYRYIRLYHIWCATDGCNICVKNVQRVHQNMHICAERLYVQQNACNSA